MKYFFAIAYLLIGLVVATRVRNVSGRFAVAYPNLPEHTVRERVACWFQLVLFLLLVVCSVRLAARFATGGVGADSAPSQAPTADEPRIYNDTELARERLFSDFQFELNQLPEESPPPKH